MAVLRRARDTLRGIIAVNKETLSLVNPSLRDAMRSIITGSPPRRQVSIRRTLSRLIRSRLNLRRYIVKIPWSFLGALLNSITGRRERGERPGRVYVGNCKFRFSDIKGDTPDFSLISRCRNLDNHLFALIIPIRGFKKKYSIADIMVKSRYALRYQGAVALISRISTQLSALLPPRPIFPTKHVLPNSELILHTKGSLYYLP